MDAARRKAGTRRGHHSTSLCREESHGLTHQELQPLTFGVEKVISTAEGKKATPSILSLVHHPAKSMMPTGGGGGPVVATSF